MQLLNTLPSSETRSVSVQRGTFLNRGTGSFLLKPLARRHGATAPTARPTPTFVCLSAEPEDAKMTGTTRSLSRRLLALNMRQDA